MGKVDTTTDSDALRKEVASLQDQVSKLEMFAHAHIARHEDEEALTVWEKIKKLFS